jgi:adenylate cyclase
MLALGGKDEPQKMTPSREQRRLSAVLAADVAGYTRLVERDTEGTVSAWQAARAEVIEPTVAAFAGRIVKLTGDGFLAEFPTVQDAVQCAIAMQAKLQGNPLDFRMGINLGDIIDDGADIHGEGVNIAARIEALAEPGGICISAAVHEQVRNRLEQDFQDMGEHEVKHVSAPVGVYRIGSLSGASSAPETGNVGRAEKPSIAVLPFDNMSGNPDQEYFSDGVTEDIITALSRYRWFFVTARNSTFSYKGKGPDLKQVGRELGVRYILEGSVRRAGDRVRVTAQLIEAASGNHLWAERYDRSLDDIFELQDEITRTVVGAIEPEISRAEQDRAKRKAPDNLDAWDNYQRGLFHFYQATQQSFVEAEQYFAKSMALDPEFGPAYGMLARTLTRGAVTVLNDDAEPALERARTAARQAVKLDPRDASAHVAMGFALERSDRSAAIGSLEEALALNPDSSLAHFCLGRMLILSNQPELGIEHLQSAIRLSPRDHFVGVWLWNIGAGYFALNEFEKVIELTSRAIRMQVVSRYNGVFRIAALALLGKQPQAHREREQYISRNPEMTIARICSLYPNFVATLKTGLELAGFPE